jgi:hypothetical protein
MNVSSRLENSRSAPIAMCSDVEIWPFIVALPDSHNDHRPMSPLIAPCQGAIARRLGSSRRGKIDLPTIAP